MSQLRLDPLTGRWVVISADRADRPAPFAPRLQPAQEDPNQPCPFCLGNEGATPPALETYGPDGAWLVRVVPNLYPAFSGRECMTVHNSGPVFIQAPASGIHEVVVFTSDHHASWADLSESHAGLLMAAVRDRITQHAAVGMRYSQFITNYGREAGASLDHPHGQLLAMPFVPAELKTEQAGFERFTGACLLCTTLEAEEEVGHRVVASDDRVLTICPYWSGAPYEMLVLPRRHEAFLHEAQPPDVTAVGAAVREALSRLRRAVGDVAYNIVVHLSPFRSTADFHWHVHVLPKVTTRAGFELGTGVLINILPPEFAAAELRAATPGGA